MYKTHTKTHGESIGDIGGQTFFSGGASRVTARATSGHTIIYCLTNGILWQMEAPPPGLRKHTWVLVKQPGYSLGANITGPLRRRTTFIFYFGESFAGQLARIGVANLDITATLATNTL